MFKHRYNNRMTKIIMRTTMHDHTMVSGRQHPSFKVTIIFHNGIVWGVSINDCIWTYKFHLVALPILVFFFFNRKIYFSLYTKYYHFNLFFLSYVKKYFY